MLTREKDDDSLGTLPISRRIPLTFGLTTRNGVERVFVRLGEETALRHFGEAADESEVHGGHGTGEKEVDRGQEEGQEGSEEGSGLFYISAQFSWIQ